MTTLSTADTQSNRDEIVAAFIQVLDCSSIEASFFLESALWNIEKAVHFWLDAAGNGKRRATDIHTYQGVGQRSSSHPNFPGFVGNPMYKETKIDISDLPADWEARVSPSDGRIRFWYLPSGHSQSRIPRAFSNIIGATIEGRSSIDDIPHPSTTGFVSFAPDMNMDLKMDQSEFSGKEFNADGNYAGQGIADDASIRADTGDENPINFDGFPSSPRFDSDPSTLSSVFQSASAASLEAMGSELGFADDI